MQAGGIAADILSAPLTKVGEYLRATGNMRAVGLAGYLEKKLAESPESWKATMFSLLQKPEVCSLFLGDEQEGQK